MNFKNIIVRIMNTKRPQFIWSFAYFQLKPSAIIRIHRRVFILSWKNPRFFLINLLGLVRWIFFNAWVQIFRSCQNKSPEQLHEYNLTRFSLFLKLLKLALIHMIPPHYFFKNKLYLKKNSALDFFYKQELPSFHYYCNQSNSETNTSLRLIENKYYFSRVLQQIGIPSALGELYCVSDLQINSTLLFRKKTLFCKPNSSAQSKDAFRLEYEPISDSYVVYTALGQQFSGNEINIYLAEVFKRNKDLLIQDFIADHQELRRFSAGKNASTLRIITHKTSMSTQVLYLQLEVDEKLDVNSFGISQQFYTILPLNVDSLEIDVHFKKNYSKIIDHNISIELKEMIKKALFNCTLVHQQLINLKTVAFDVIISQQGPVILEANFNWNIEILYLIMNLNTPLIQSSHPAMQWIRSIFLSNIKI